MAVSGCNVQSRAKHHILNKYGYCTNAAKKNNSRKTI